MKRNKSYRIVAIIQRIIETTEIHFLFIVAKFQNIDFNKFLENYSINKRNQAMLIETTNI